MPWDKVGGSNLSTDEIKKESAAVIPSQNRKLGSAGKNVGKRGTPEYLPEWHALNQEKAMLSHLKSGISEAGKERMKEALEDTSSED